MENSSREPASHQHSFNLDARIADRAARLAPDSDPPDFVFTNSESADVDDPWATHELYAKYPLGTHITSLAYGELETYEVVSHAEYERELGEVLEYGYLAVKWIDGPTLEQGNDRYDGFYEHHIDGVKFSPTAAFVRDLFVNQTPLMPWVPGLSDVPGLSEDAGLVRQPQPRYGWRG